MIVIDGVRFSLLSPQICNYSMYRKDNSMFLLYMCRIDLKKENYFYLHWGKRVVV